MHEMNCFSISAHEGLNLSPALAHELTRGRQALMQKGDLLLGEIRQHLHPGLLSHQPHGIGHRRGIDGFVGERCGQLRQPADLNDRYIADRLETIFFEKHLHRKVRGGAKAAHSYGLALEIGNTLDLRRGYHIERDEIDDGTHRHEITSLKAGVDHSLAVSGGDRYLTGQHRLRHSRRGRDINQIGIQPLLFEIASIVYDPEGSLYRGYPGIADYELLCRSDCRQSEAQDKINNDKLPNKSFHSLLLCI